MNFDTKICFKSRFTGKTFSPHISSDRDNYSYILIDKLIITWITYTCIDVIFLDQVIPHAKVLCKVKVFSAVTKIFKNDLRRLC